MPTRYILQSWINAKMGYVDVWEGHSMEIAERMMHKPYNGGHSLRLIKITEEILFTKKPNGKIVLRRSPVNKEQMGID